LKGQGGIALVSVLLVVAIATVMAVAMVQEQQASTQAARSLLSRGQATQYALGGEELARQILYEDFLQGNGIDHLRETWADPELHFEFVEGEINLQITDLQGLFNLNGLSPRNSRQAIVRQRLLNLVAAEGGDISIADRLQDWIDADISARASGAEDYNYLGFEPPYRTGNTPMQDPSETVLVGMTPEQYFLFGEVMSALPRLDAALNINTAPAEVLMSLSPSLTPEIAEVIAGNRDLQEGFETVEAFLQQPELAGLGVAREGLGVQSSFFSVQVIARYQDRFNYLSSVIHRNASNGEMHVISRDFSRKMPVISGRGSNDD